jgi:NhaP-type Na+/H+ or K+/H+ antiporter
MPFHDNPALTVAIALAAGVLAQSAARHLGIPGIVLLIASGIVLGPDLLGVVRPDSLGESLHVLVGFAVAVILFEGGLNLDWRRLRREARTIQLLISVGGLVTAAGGTLAARLVLGWEWRLSVLFGCLVIVTGPTVVTPLLRRIKVKRNLETVLEAEGVLIDAVGAIVAVVALEVLINPTASLHEGMINVPLHLLVGVVFGAVGGAAIALALRRRSVVPEGLENVFTLSLVLTLFQLSNTIVSETGIVSVVAAGLVMGNIRTPLQRELREFKEQITMMFIGLLFVLLAADVRHADAVNLGAAGVAVVVLLMFVVRPLSVLLCTIGSGMDWREKAFLSWIAPRGVVAVTVATLFDESLTAAGVTSGHEMRALVFLVIVMTVVFQGLTGPKAASVLGVRRRSGQGYALLGSTPLSRALAGLLREHAEDVVLIDGNAEACKAAEQEGLRVVYGNGLGERVLMSAEIESRKAAVGLLGNEAVNLLFARKAKLEHKVPQAAVAVQQGHGGIEPAMVHEAGAGLLFGGAADLELWSVRIRRGLSAVELWNSPDEGAEGPPSSWIPQELQQVLLPLLVLRAGVPLLVVDQLKLRPGDGVYWLIFQERAEQARQRLGQLGWHAKQA